MIGSVLRDPIRGISARRLVLLRVGIVAGLLLLGLVTGILIAHGRLDPMLLLAGAVGALGLLIWHRVGRFEHGILAIALAGGLLNFFTLPTGTQSRIVISLLIALALAGLWLLEMLVTTKRITLEPSPINKPLLAFVVISVVAYLWSTLLRDPLVFVPKFFSARARSGADGKHFAAAPGFAGVQQDQRGGVAAAVGLDRGRVGRVQAPVHSIQSSDGCHD